jgi:predicted dehydrogenase
MGKVRFGILGTAKIAIEKVIPAMQSGLYTDVTAIASREQSRARHAAEKLGIAKHYGSYDDLLADPEIDAIYNPLPNHLHVPLSIKAIEAGKHVLCEKPIALTSDEGQKLVDVAKTNPGMKVMEAFMYRLHPQWKKSVEIVRSGGIGTLRTINSVFSYFNDDKNNIRNMVSAGGGGLMDIGCYCISLARLLFGKEPTRVAGIMELDPDFKTDRLTSGILDFGSGTATFTCSTQLTPYQRVNIYGTKGRIEIEIPFNAPPDKRCRIWHQTPKGIEEISFPVCDQYTIQGDEFARAIMDGTSVPTPIEDAVGNMKVMETLVASVKRKIWEMV